MTQTPKLGITYVQAAQAQKHVTVNEGFRGIDALVQSGVLDKDLSTPPASPLEGDGYIVAPGGTGAWAGQDNKIVVYYDDAWTIYTPNTGWFTYVDDESLYYSYDGSSWGPLSSVASTNPVPFVGVNTTASDPNKLAVKSDAVLMSHDDVTPGTGDMRQTINKAGAGNTASVVFQSNWSGRAEFGLTGDDEFHMKVSPDGSTFYEGVVIDQTTGVARFPNAIRIGGNAVANELDDYEEGVWVPTLGGVKSNNYSAATGLTVIEARYQKIGGVVTVHAVFTLTGLTSGALTQDSSFQVAGLPFTPILIPSTSIGVSSVSGILYQSVSGSINTAITGTVGTQNSIYCMSMFRNGNMPDITGTHMVSLTYYTNN